jgi:hypothetical protein
MRRAPWVLWVLAASCVHHVEAGAPVAPQAVRLLGATLERETSALKELRTDLEVDTDFERIPHVIATGETGLLRADGARFTLAGDEAGTKEVFIDNFILLEVVLPDGRVTARAVVGYVDGVSQGKERIDMLGQQTFTLGPKEVSLETIVPEHGQFRLRATALDIGGVGRVSDVFVLVNPRAEAAADELR